MGPFACSPAQCSGPSLTLTAESRRKASMSPHAAETLNATPFDLFLHDAIREGSRVQLSNRLPSASQLKEICSCQAEQAVRGSVLTHAPDVPMSRLEDALRLSLEPFVHPGTGRIGHAFPLEGGGIEGPLRSSSGVEPADFQAKNTPRRSEASHASRSRRPQMASSTAHCNCWSIGSDANRFECTCLPSCPICFRVLPHPLSATCDFIPRIQAICK